MPGKWHLLRTVERGRTALGLKGTSIALLRAILSLIRSDQLSGQRDADHICFASNATLAERTHVSIQTVERHITLLVNAGLIRRRASGNGKRWARRDRGGQIVRATGLSVLPLLERQGELAALVTQHDAQQEKLAALRDQCVIALGQLVDRSSDRITALKAKARTLLRRKPDGAALAELLAEITAELAEPTPLNAEEMRGSDPEIEGQKETDQIQNLVRKKISDLEVTPAAMERAYPRLCAELRTARHAEDCARRMEEVAGHLHLGDLWFSLIEMGPTIRFMVLGYLLERVDRIRRPKAYASRLLRDLQGDTLDVRSLLQPVRRSRGLEPNNLANLPSDGINARI